MIYLICERLYNTQEEPVEKTEESVMWVYIGVYEL